MADFLTWRDDWQTGIEWLDRDHRELLDRLNGLAAANDRAAGDLNPPGPKALNSECLAALDALFDQCRRHFAAEESFLLEIDYPGYNTHRSEHVMQLAEFTEMRRALEQDDSRVLGPDSLAGLKRWFFNHVIAEDRGYVDYYQRALETRPTAPPPRTQAMRPSVLR